MRGLLAWTHLAAKRDGPVNLWIRYFHLQFVPQTVFSCRGSYGVVKGALNGLTTRWRCVASVLLVKTMVWWHLPSKTHSKINILIELLHSSREVAHFSLQDTSWSLIGTLLATGRLWDDYLRHLGYPPKFYRVQDAISGNNSTLWYYSNSILMKNHQKHCF